MSSQQPDEQRSWFPLALAGAVVVFALLVAVLAYLANRHGDPSRASTVQDVASLAVEAVDNADREFAAELACGSPTPELTSYAGQQGASAAAAALSGEETGSFRLTVTGSETAEWEVTVGRDGDRSCVESLRLVRGPATG